MKNPFWINVITYFYSFISNYQPRTKNEVNAIPFLYNNNITIGGKATTSTVLTNKHIFFIHQLKTEDRFMTHQEFNQTYDLSINFLHFRSTLNAIKAYTANIITFKSKETINLQPALNIIMKTPKGTAPIYREKIKTKDKIMGFEKWERLTNIQENEWFRAFRQLKYTTKETKLRWLQFRILHNILSTNRSVSKFKAEQCELCTFCNAHSETIQHLILDCSKVKLFWNNLANILNNRATHAHNFRFTDNIIIFGLCDIVHTDKTCDFIILAAKFYIYRCKVQKDILNIKTFISELYNKYCVEKIIYKNSTAFKNRWGPYINIFRSLI